MNTQIIPVFPLPIVQFPGALTTLHIFEAKYKKMLNDILDSDKIFGIHYTSSGDNEPLMSIVGGAGCIVEVAVVQGMPDGRSNILCIGQKRYRILSIIDDDPYITADVELFEDEPTFDDLTHLTSNSKKHFHRVLAASRKLNDELDQGSSEGELPELPDDPQTLSFIVTAYLDIATEEKQKLLEMTNTEERLKTVNVILEKVADDYEQKTFVHGIAKQNGHAGEKK